MDRPQPSQKAFESALALALARLDPVRPVLVEAESSKIGERLLPPSLWAAMKAAPRIEIAAPLEARAAYLARAYDDILSDGARLAGKLAHLRAHRGKAVVEGWLALIASGDRAALVRALMEQHYDPAYAKSRKVVDAPVLARVEAGRLDAAGLDAAAGRIEAALAQAPASLG